MPIGVLKFRLPEEQEEFDIAVNAGTLYASLHDIAEYVRQLRKYDERKQLPTDEVISKLVDMLEEFYILRDK